MLWNIGNSFVYKILRLRLRNVKNDNSRLVHWNYDSKELFSFIYSMAKRYFDAFFLIKHRRRLISIIFNGKTMKFNLKKMQVHIFAF